MLLFLHRMLRFLPEREASWQVLCQGALERKRELMSYLWPLLLVQFKLRVEALFSLRLTQQRQQQLQRLWLLQFQR